MNRKADVIIVGGGVIGSSIAYNLLEDGFDGKVIVFEKDKTYEFASTPRSAGGIRQLFTTKVNVEMGKYDVDYYSNFKEDMEIDGENAKIDFQQNGYLFLVENKEDVVALQRQKKVQKNCGVDSTILQKDELKNIIPELNTDDLSGGIYSGLDGYLDPYSVMQGYIKKSRQLGATYVNEKIVKVNKNGNNVSGVFTENGTEYYAPIVINCAGPWGTELSETVNLPLPIIPLKRQIIQFNIEEPLENRLPLTVDPTGVYFRHEGNSIICGFGEEIKPGIEFSWKRSFFTDFLWPILANRIPNFERAKIQSGWAGIYSHNTMDQNAIVGEHPELKGYHLALGFSGHGMQQAPAVGKGLSEYIRNNHYDTIDLSVLGFDRFKNNKLVIEEAIV